MIYLVTKAQIESRLSAKRLKRIYDDNNDGTADTNPIKQLRADASSKVRSYLEPMGMMPAIEALFDQDTGELLPDKVLPDEIIRLTLDAVTAIAAQRHPETMRVDWRPLMEQSDKDLARLRDGKTTLGGGTQGGIATPSSDVSLATVTTTEVSADGSTTRITRRWDDMADY